MRKKLLYHTSWKKRDYLEISRECCGQRDINFLFAYAIGNTSWKNGFDDDAGATSADDAESKTAAIIDEIYHFNLSPFRIQLRKKRSQRRL